MKVSRFLAVMFIVCAVFTVASGNDSTATAVPDSLKSTAKLTVAGPITAPDAFTSFSAINKKYLKKSIITNALYVGGFGLLYGVVLPGLNRTEKGLEQYKWLPLEYLATGMMYASLPINIVSSYHARSNYKYYYKIAPANIALPLTLAGAGLCIGAAGGSLWNSIADYKDNKELDGSYNKYGKVSMNLFTAGLITFAGTNLYGLAYTIILGEKAKQNSAPSTASLQIAPMRYGNANGGVLTWNF